MTETGLEELARRLCCAWISYQAGMTYQYCLKTYISALPVSLNMRNWNSLSRSWSIVCPPASRAESRGRGDAPSERQLASYRQSRPLGYVEPTCGDASNNHAASVLCWLSTAVIFRQPSILRNLIWPLATRLKSRTMAASSLGSEPCVFTRLRSSS